MTDKTARDRAAAFITKALEPIRPAPGFTAPKSFALLVDAAVEFGLEERRAVRISNAAAAEFLRSHGQVIFESACGGEPRCEIDLELALVMRKLGERVDDGTERYELDDRDVMLDESGETRRVPKLCRQCGGAKTLEAPFPSFETVKCDRCNGSGTDPDDRKEAGGDD